MILEAIAHLILSSMLESKDLSKNSFINLPTSERKVFLSIKFIYWVIIMLRLFFKLYSNEVLCSLIILYNDLNTFKFFEITTIFKKDSIIMWKFYFSFVFWTSSLDFKGKCIVLTYFNEGINLSIIVSFWSLRLSLGL